MRSEYLAKAVPKETVGQEAGGWSVGCGRTAWFGRSAWVGQAKGAKGMGRGSGLGRYTVQGNPVANRVVEKIVGRNFFSLGAIF